MFRQALSRSAFLLSIILPLLSPAGLGAQEPKPKKAPKAEAPVNKAREVLDQMSAFYAGAKTIKVSARTVMKMNMQGMNMDINGTSKISAERPNKFSSLSQGQGMMAMAMSNTMISDGTTMTIYMPMMKRYMQKDAPEDFSGLAGVAGGTGAEAFVIALLNSGLPGASLFDGLSGVKYVGQEDLNGTPCHHVSFASASSGLDTMGLGKMNMDVWIEAGEKPFLRRIKPDFAGMFSKLGEQLGGGAGGDAHAKECQANLTKIEGMKEQWSLENSKGKGAKPTAENLKAYLNRDIPICPSGKAYVINPIGKDPLCLSGLEGHDLASAEAAGELAGLEGLEGLGDMGAMFEGMEMDASFEYDGWETDAPIPAETFVFTPPEGAQKTDNLYGDMGLGDMGGLDALGGLGAPESPGENEEPEAFGASEDDDLAKKLEGKPAPAFKLPLAGGGEFDLAAQKGEKIVILDFWATWCGPCRKSMPGLIKVAKDYESKGVVLIAVNLEESGADVLEFIKNEKWDVKVALDSDYSVGELYMAEAIPETVVVGRDGSIALVHVGASENFDATLRAKLDELLAGK